MDNLIFGVMDSLDNEYNYAILFFVKMGSYCLGLHDKTLRCEVITFQNNCYALVFWQGIFVDFYHAVGTEVLLGYLGDIFCI